MRALVHGQRQQALDLSPPARLALAPKRALFGGPVLLPFTQRRRIHNPIAATLSGGCRLSSMIRHTRRLCIFSKNGVDSG
jgi:hypothetical protein